MTVVVRYYGGTKLGTGGLVRAYSGTCAECLRAAPTFQVRPRVQRQAYVTYDRLSVLYHLLDQFETERGEERYSGAGVRLSLELYPEDVAAFSRALQNATRGVGFLKEL